MKSIIFAGGCFWGVQNYFNQVKGVINSRVGYTAGFIDFPTYNQVCSGKTGHTEACIVHYNSSETSLNILLEHFFNIVDPTLVDQQGPDVGSQYRSGIYYYETEVGEEIINYIKNIKDNYNSEIVTEVMECEDFWEAEEYHQNYLEKNPGGYCHIEPDKYYCSIKIDYVSNKQVIAMCNINNYKENELTKEMQENFQESKQDEDNNFNHKDNNYHISKMPEKNDYNFYNDESNEEVLTIDEIVDENKVNGTYQQKFGNIDYNEVIKENLGCNHNVLQSVYLNDEKDEIEDK